MVNRVGVGFGPIGYELMLAAIKAVVLGYLAFPFAKQYDDVAFRGVLVSAIRTILADETGMSRSFARAARHRRVFASMAIAARRLRAAERRMRSA